MSKTDTVEKYTTVLQKLIHEVESKRAISTTKFSKEHKVNALFVRASKELNYIKENGVKGRYLPVMKQDEVQPIHARRLAERISTMYKEPSVPSESSVPNPLSEYSDDTLLAELKRRGYSGSVTKNISI